jgi:hypothetical protein
MPLASLQIIGRPKHEKEGPKHQEAVPTEEIAQGGPEPLAGESLDDQDEEVTDEDASFDEISVEEIDEEVAIDDEKLDTKRPVKGLEFTAGALVRVKKSAGANSDEQHLVRRQGQVGRIIRNCEIATACVEVDFEDGKLPVLIPKSLLQGVNNAPEAMNAEEAPKPRPAKKTQLKLPF